MESILFCISLIAIMAIGCFTIYKCFVFDRTHKLQYPKTINQLKTEYDIYGLDQHEQHLVPFNESDD